MSDDIYRKLYPATRVVEIAEQRNPFADMLDTEDTIDTVKPRELTRFERLRRALRNLRQRVGFAIAGYDPWDESGDEPW